MGIIVDALRGYFLVMLNGVPLVGRGALNLQGPGVTAVDNPGAKRTDVTIDANGSGTVEPTPNTTAKRGTNGEGYFAWMAPTTSTDPLSGAAETGFLRFRASDTVLIAIRDGAEAGRDLPILRMVSRSILLGTTDTGGPKSIEIAAWNGSQITLSGEGSGQAGEVTESFSGGTARRKVGTPLSTSDETPATLLQITAADDSTYVLGLDVVATSAAGSYVLTVRIPVAVASGVLTATLPAAALDSLGLVSGSGGVALSWSGGLLTVTATGLPATDIAWKSRVELL